MKNSFTILETKKPGDTLDTQEANQLQQCVELLIEAAMQRRKNILLYHDSLQNTIGLFLQMNGCEVEYEVPFQLGGYTRDSVVFDIVARNGEWESVIEVKDVVTSRDLGQVHGYAVLLRITEQKAQVYLGTDVINFDEVVSGMVGEMVRELMEKKHVGIVLADKYFLIVFDNYNQLSLREMPLFLFSEEKVG